MKDDDTVHTIPSSSIIHKTMKLQILLPTILLRLSFLLILANNALTSILPGLLPAINSAILDPIHSWDQFAEACFWRRHRGYDGMYEAGTRVSIPPLLMMLGEHVCDTSMSPRYLLGIRQFLVLVADVVGAFCIYGLCEAVVESEERGEEWEMERRTMLDDGKDQALVVPGVLRAEKGWIFGLPTKVAPLNRNDEPMAQEKAGEVCESCTKESNQSPGNASNHEEKSKVIANDPGETANGYTLNPQHANNTNTHNPPSHPQPILSPHQLPIIASILYLINPIAILAAAQSLRSLWDMLLLLSLYYATSPLRQGWADATNQRRYPTGAKCAFYLALATYVDVAYAAFLVPVLLWRGLWKDESPTLRGRRRACDWKRVFVLYLVYYGALHGMAFSLVRQDGMVYRKIMVKTILPNVAFVELDESGSFPGPSMGLHWYFFVQMFDRFRPYFTTLVSGLPAVFVIPLTIRLYRYPSVLIAAFQLLWAIFRPTTTVHTLTLGLTFVLLNPRTIVRMRDPSLIAFFALPVPMLLFVTFHRMWLVTGNGNPNYIFFQCFAYGLFVAVITLDVVSATVKRDKVRRMVVKGDTMKSENSPKQIDGEQKEEPFDKAGKPEVSDEIRNTHSEIESEPEPVVVFL